MKTIYNICCGLDVHKDSIVACMLKTRFHVRKSNKKEQFEKEIRIFNTFSNGLNELKSWLIANDCHHVAMESTGVYWHPVYDVLENAYDGDIEILVVNARHMKNVPGKKTDIKDAEWIADLLRCGLLRGSFIPPQAVRELRELTRYRKSIVEDISRQKNRIEKTLQTAGFKLSTFLSDIFGVSGRNIITVLIKKGYLTKNDVDISTKYISADKKNEIKRVLTNHLSTHHRTVLEIKLKHLDELISHLNLIEKSIDELTVPFDNEINCLDTIPGISDTSATAIIAEIGTDMSKFPTSEHLCSWTGLSPGNHESAGKKKAQESLTEIHT